MRYLACNKYRISRSLLQSENELLCLIYMLNKFIFMTVSRIYPTTEYPSLSNPLFFFKGTEIMLKPRSDAKGKKKKKLKHKYDKRKKLKGALEIFCLLGKHRKMQLQRASFILKCSFIIFYIKAAWSPWKELWQENQAVRS